MLKKCSFIDLAHALVPGLDMDALDAAFKIASSAANEKEAASQKRAYKLLSAICAAKKGAWLAKMSKDVEMCLMDAGDVRDGGETTPVRGYRVRTAALTKPRWKRKRRRR